MKIAKYIVSAGIGLAVLAPDSHALLGFGKSKQEDEKPQSRRKYHMIIPDRETEERLMSLLQRQRLLNEDIKVLNRLISIRIPMLEKIDTVLSSEFYTEGEGKYTLNTENMTIYVIDQETGEKKEHVKLTDPQRVQRFEELYEQQLKLRIELKVLDRVRREQQRVNEQTKRVLYDEFSIDPERYYFYDNKQMTLYEIEKPQ